MFSGLFLSKMEKELMGLQERGKELELQYSSGESLAVSLLLKVIRNQIVILGFYEKLKSPELICKFLSNGATFKTTVRKKSVDSNGNYMFHCDLPAKVDYVKPPQRYTIKGKESTCKILVSTNRGEQSVVLPVWEITELGATLQNNSKVHIKIGTKLFQAMMTIGSGQGHLVDLQVANIRKTPDGDLLVCAFSREPRGLSEMLSQGKSLAPKPKPKPKK